MRNVDKQKKHKILLEKFKIRRIFAPDIKLHTKTSDGQFVKIKLGVLQKLCFAFNLFNLKVNI